MVCWMNEFSNYINLTDILIIEEDWEADVFDTPYVADRLIRHIEWIYEEFKVRRLPLVLAITSENIEEVNSLVDSFRTKLIDYFVTYVSDYEYSDCKHSKLLVMIPVYNIREVNHYLNDVYRKYMEQAINTFLPSVRLDVINIDEMRIAHTHLYDHLNWFVGRVNISLQGTCCY